MKLGLNSTGVRRAFSVGLTIAMSAGITAATATGAGASRTAHTPSLTVGVLLAGTPNDAGYSQAQWAGITYLKAHMKGIKVLAATGVATAGGADVNAEKTMISEGAKLIFLQGFQYQYGAYYGLAPYSPGVVFEAAGGTLAPLSTKNFGDYWASSYDVNYALGVAAAKIEIAKSPKHPALGFIGAQGIPTVLSSAMAFHLGAQSVSPKITTHVIWEDNSDGSWSNPAVETAAVATLHAAGVGVVGTLIDSPITVATKAPKVHIWVIGYHSAAGSKFAGKYWLSSVAFNWGPMFVKMATDVENGTWASSVYDSNYVASIQTRTASMGPFGPAVTPAEKAAATSSFTKFMSGKMLNPFKGPIYNQAGTLMVPKGQYLSTAQQDTLNWLAKGMIGATS